MPGLRWKVWLLDESQQAAGGIYLFETKAALDAMLSSELWAGVAANPAIQDVNLRVWDVMDGPSLITRAPIQEAIVA